VQLVPRVAASVERAPAVTQQQALPSAPVVSPPPPAPSAATQAPRENASEQIAAVIAAYARALESRDIGELRRVYPSVSADQRRAFEEFFRSTRTLSAKLSVASLQVDGASAEAQVNGAFDYVTTSGTTEHQPVSFRAALRREHGGWVLAAIR
jgi:hypothetical protein